MPKFMICIDGKVYEIYAQGRAKAVQAGINEHYGQPLAAKVLFVRYMTGSVVYEATTSQGVIEVIVKQ
jgi:hypothetical protein